VGEPDGKHCGVVSSDCLAKHFLAIHGRETTNIQGMRILNLSKQVNVALKQSQNLAAKPLARVLIASTYRDVKGFALGPAKICQ